MYNFLINRELNERESEILQRIVHLYILNGNPIGSRFLSKTLENEMKLSPATLRNIMADLEDMEFITHPHTSAGRIPTDKGYRFYVNNLEKKEKLNKKEINVIQNNLLNTNQEDTFQNASKLLGALSKYLSIIELPSFKKSIVRNIELILLRSNKILIVVELESDFVKTITLEMNFDIDSKYLNNVNQILNEKITGKTLEYIREHFAKIFSETDFSETPLIRLFTDSVDKIFQDNNINNRIVISGTTNLLYHPEFEDLKKVRTIIELIENEEIIVHVLEKCEENDNINVLIGKELEIDMLDDYSLIRSSFKIGKSKGSIGIIGPKRMDYSKMISLVSIFSEILSKVK
jgi:heat-inducible transcriptional repressor